ncbi:MAG: DinB family protein [Ilumatobacteraceae bacterium]
MTELAPDPELSPQADEAGVLHSFLEYYRSIFLRKTDGLTEAQARTTIEPSELTILGLVRHMAEVERGWFRRRIAGHLDQGMLYCDDEDQDRDFHPAANDTLAGALAVLHDEIEASRAATAGVAPDALMKGVPPQQRIPGWQPNVRWVMVHMIEEYARHCGHLDLLRERIDGATGD